MFLSFHPPDQHLMRNFALCFYLVSKMSTRKTGQCAVCWFNPRWKYTEDHMCKWNHFTCHQFFSAIVQSHLTSPAYLIQILLRLILLKPIVVHILSHFIFKCLVPKIVKQKCVFWKLDFATYWTHRIHYKDSRFEFSMIKYGNVRINLLKTSCSCFFSGVVMKD